MGRIGSVTWSRWDKRTTLESTKRIDIRYMRNAGFLKPGYRGKLFWWRGGKPTGDICFTCHADYLKLNYKIRNCGDKEWQFIEQVIRFTSTPCNYGGYRLWFLCPGCQRRVEILCSDGPLFKCRHCYNLPHASKNECYIERLINRRAKLGERIFEHFDNGDGWGKKKGMHWKTYDRLFSQYAHLDTEWEQVIRSRL
jgi:hypothetical protein